MVAQVASKVFGANVIGTCSTSKVANVPLPRERIVNYSGFPVTLVDSLRSLTPNKQGFDVVFDGVGKSTYAISLDVTRARGLVVFFGNASGPVPPIDPLILSAKGSLFMTRPKLYDYVATHEELLVRAKDVFEWNLEGKLVVPMDKEFNGLETIEDALMYVKAGNATGKVFVKV